MNDADIPYQRIIDNLSDIIPNEGDGFNEDYIFILEDTMAAAIYTLRGIVTGEAQESAWAARRVYESLDRFESVDLRVQEYSSTSESRILGSELIQVELSRQRRDINELLSHLDIDVGNLARTHKDRSEREPAIPPNRICP